ncbi:sensor histidine kinase YesM [Bacillus tianshenii]|uniref:Sensor histidine kinase YesM n=1 Tax=Sutcliffiella tianshenii TaxID=1463404 RepID=A0ABS2P215_9BACI|nr:hypothetical protein [Bacillus tianshenii]MBM7620914.1 sensor histidine kinase YesM [Bacillus tianshenii]
MEMYDYMMILNVLVIISSAMISYLYVSQMVLRKGAFLFHTMISLSFVVIAWFVTTSIWYYLTIQVDGLLYLGGMLFNLIVMMFCITVLISYLVVRRSYLLKHYQARNK